MDSLLTVVVRCDNAAFLPDASVEVARLLRDLADRLEDRELPRYSEATGSSFDVNGNAVLDWSWAPRRTDPS